MKSSQVVSVVGIALYGALGLFMIISFLYTTITKKKEVSSLATNVRRVFRGFISVFLLSRLVWLILHSFSDSSVSSFILNRVSIVTFLSAFTLVAFYWAEQFHKNYYETSSLFLPKVGWAFIVLNALIYIFQLVMIILYLVLDKEDEREGNPIYDINIIVDVVLSAIVSVAFFVYGWLLFCLVRKSESTAGRLQELLKILVISFIFTACFLCRVVVFSYRPITQKTFNEIAFYVCAYYLPELVPTALQVYISESTNQKQETDTKYIASLYQEADSSVDEIDQSPNERTRLWNGNSPNGSLSDYTVIEDYYGQNNP